MEETDYEALPESCSMSDHMLAGASAGIMEHCVMYPIDSVKTRMQCFTHRYGTVAAGLGEMLRTEGLFRSLRGIGALITGSGPAHALYFATYEHFKSSLAKTHLENYYLAPAISGAAATLMHDSIMTPADAVKQRLQMYNSPYTSSLDCIRQMLSTEGPVAFYRSFLAQLSMNAPYQMIHFVVYEAAQDYVNPSHKYQPWTHVVSGGLGGAIAAALTTPLDVCKTILNTQEELVLHVNGNTATSRPISGLRNAANFIYRREGLLGFSRGLSARVLTSMPGAAISWSVYEYFKWRLKVKNSQVQKVPDMGLDKDDADRLFSSTVLCATNATSETP
ncbi:hypothetical protein Ciccas_007953 [Cichlidogyrus casuarinus]|uniref:Mitoferrin-1 n=1 Tax=Cichlidogyrus casuarinus TaxID=1844966 RepID=A0ABD2Q2J8_9PLAT